MDSTMDKTRVKVLRSLKNKVLSTHSVTVHTLFYFIENRLSILFLKDTYHLTGFVWTVVWCGHRTGLTISLLKCLDIYCHVGPHWGDSTQCQTSQWGQYMGSHWGSLDSVCTLILHTPKKQNTNNS